MNAPDVVERVVELLQGGSIPVGGSTVSLSDGVLSFDVEPVDGRDVLISFTGTKPIATYWGAKVRLHGLKVCVKGVKIDAEMIPSRIDPFVSWEQMGLA